ncbi:MAG: hypothetical protein EXS46_01750 [Candidatus Taylorbacteria bacterium]|nr:hypothetical protein [Candidatus Taylorbacteria bacterium]
MILDLIENLRKKPVAYRKRVVFVLSTVITIIILTFWLGTFNYRFGGNETSPELSQEGLKPIQEIKSSISNFIDSVKKIGSNVFGSLSATTTQKFTELKK